jgi:hypothetical protein|tara:strand:+ start:636 stop:887 length:252 start_codon:yes stop_codon:yes gene_type:complete
MYIKLREKLINDLKHLEKMYKQYLIPLNLDWKAIKKEKREIILQNLVTRLDLKLNSFLNQKPSYNNWMEDLAKQVKETKDKNE